MSDDYQVKSVSKLGSNLLVVLEPTPCPAEGAAFLGVFVALGLMGLFGLQGLGAFVCMWVVGTVISTYWAVQISVIAMIGIVLFFVQALSSTPLIEGC